MKTFLLLCCITATTAWLPLKADAQFLALNQRTTGDTEIKAALGDTLNIVVNADLGRYSASGLNFYIELPAHGFELLDRSPSDLGMQPFMPGALFGDALEVVNCVLPITQAPVPENRQLIHYAMLLGPGQNRSTTGSGIAASFSVVCVELVSGAKVGLFTSPVFETRMVLSDGRTEKQLYRDVDLDISVSLFTTVELTPWGRIKENGRN